MLVLLAYDTPDGKHQTFLRTEFERVGGRRIQYSVFECALGDTAWAKLRVQLDGLIHHTEDQILLFDLGPLDGRAREAVSSLGKLYVLPKIDSVVI